MSVADEYFRETHMIGPGCRERMLDCGQFPLLRNAPFIWVGKSELTAPYRMVRLRSVHSHIVVPLKGAGQVLIDGAVRDFSPGQVMLGPVGAHHAFGLAEGGSWTLAWVFYDDREAEPVLPQRRATLVEADGEDFAAALHMLLREASGAAEPSAMTALVTLLDVAARRLAGGDGVDPRLRRLWQEVEENLASDWSVRRMAARAAMSEEHLRRLCRHHYQESPASRLANLRMRRAATMLRSSPAKTEDIALRVGYASMYSFSVAFHRWSGLPPSEFRRKAS